MKLLLHSCCAPCSVYCISALKEEKLTPDLFWFNPNIHPFTEHKSRKESLILLAEKENLTIIDYGQYGLRDFIKGLNGDYDNRCQRCYRLRLEETAKYAAANGYKAFSTTLLISIYQNHQLIINIAQKMAEKYKIEFLYRDFRPHFRYGQNQARQEGYYMQKYCGCIFSEEERYCKNK